MAFDINELKNTMNEVNTELNSKIQSLITQFNDFIDNEEFEDWLLNTLKETYKSTGELSFIMRLTPNVYEKGLYYYTILSFVSMCSEFKETFKIEGTYTIEKHKSEFLELLSEFYNILRKKCSELNLNIETAEPHWDLTSNKRSTYTINVTTKNND